MKTLHTQRFILAVFLILSISLFQVLDVFAQNKKGGDEGTIKLRIEKQKDGKTEVIEKTYKAGDVPGVLFYNWPDSLKNFGENFHMQFDTLFPSLSMPDLSDMSFNFKINDSAFFQNQFLFKKGMDSLLKKHQQMEFKFNYELKPSIDSMMDKLMNSQNEFKFQFEKSFDMDSVFNMQAEAMKNFEFNWFDDGYNKNGLNLMLDKELYNVEEVEDDNGNKMLKITPKTQGRVKKEVPPTNSKHTLQPSSAQLNLHFKSTNKHLTISFTLPEKGNTTVSVVNPKGKEIYKEKLKNFSGSYNKEVNLQKEGTGVFVVQVTQNSTNISKKVDVK